MKTAEQIEQSESETARNPARKYKRGENPEFLAHQWKPGESGNPGGRKRDLAQEIARAVFEKNPELVYAAFVRALNKGGAYAYQVLADRAYGKLKEQVEVTSTDSSQMSYEEIQERVAQLERELYPAVFPRVAAEADEAGRTAKTQSTTEAPEAERVLPAKGAVKA